MTKNQNVEFLRGLRNECMVRITNYYNSYYCNNKLENYNYTPEENREFKERLTLNIDLYEKGMLSLIDSCKGILNDMDNIITEICSKEEN